MKLKILFMLALSVSVPVFSAQDDKVKSPPTLQEALDFPSIGTSVSKNINGMRYEALRSMGLEYGLQAGLAYQYRENIKRLDTLVDEMEKTYPFQSLMLEGNVIPPIISEVIGVFDQQSAVQIRIADKERTIIAPPRFSYAAPSYRDYFLHDFSFSTSALGVAPKNKDEEAVWKDAVTIGYEAGREQAMKVFSDDAARLSRDFNGMRLYHQLLNAGKVTRPYVVVAHSSVTGDKNLSMKEGESHLEISVAPEFVMDSSNWKVNVSSKIQERISTLVDPEAGAAIVVNSGVSRESKSIENKRKLK